MEGEMGLCQDDGPVDRPRQNAQGYKWKSLLCLLSILGLFCDSHVSLLVVIVFFFFVLLSFGVQRFAWHLVVVVARSQNIRFTLALSHLGVIPLVGLL